MDDNDAFDIDRIVAQGTTLGDNDIIQSGDGDAFIFGGTGSDTITAGAGRDLIFGDHGQLIGNIATSHLPLGLLNDQFTFTSIDTQSTYTNSNDLIRAGAGDDIVVGGQGADRVRGEAGDDDLIGGHTVADGSDQGDILDAGSGHDVVAGDNATIYREPRTTDARWRILSGAEILQVDGNGAVTAEAGQDPLNRPKRTVTLLNHTSTTVAGVFGNDQIAGGSGDDQIFGQLGDDSIQGDGHVLALNGSLTIDLASTLLSVDDFDGAGTDGDDYVEGGGGNDILFGNLGQDDLIGGSSNLFGTSTTSHRPDGRMSSTEAPVHVLVATTPVMKRSMVMLVMLMSSSAITATSSESWASTESLLAIMCDSATTPTALCRSFRAQLNTLNTHLEAPLKPA